MMPWRELAKGSFQHPRTASEATERAFAGKAGLLSLQQEPWQLLWVTSWPQPPSLLRNQGRQSRSGVPPRRQWSRLASFQSRLLSSLSEGPLFLP